MTEKEKGLLTKFEGQVKKLPRGKDGKLCKTFVANGNNYIIWDWRDGVPIDRWHVYQLMSVMFKYGASLNQLHNNIDEADKTLNNILRGDNEKTAIDVVYHLRGINKGLINEASSRYPIALKKATIFILREDEDIHSWDETIAAQKMEDWAKEGYGVEDFFTLATTSLKTMNKKLIEGMANGLEKE